MENKDLEIKKDQLLSEGEFIAYCNDSNDVRVSQYGKLRIHVEPAFLRAAEQDGFLEPLLISEEPVRQADGSQKTLTVHYYSPFQIYIIAQLACNILEDGKLQDPHSNDSWHKERSHRFVIWGYGGGWSSNVEQKNRGEKDPNGHPTPLGVSKYLCNFLRLLHSLDVRKPYSEGWIPERGRYYKKSPDLQFNIELLRKGGTDLLNKYDLDKEKLTILRGNVGHAAASIDPLEKWYPFIQRLPQWRKDELKGEALLAQDLYGLCKLISDVIEIVTGDRPRALQEELQSNFLGRRDKQNEYASGTDIEAIKLAATKFREWFANEKNLELVKEIIKNDLFDGYGKRLDEIELQLKSYEEHYAAYGMGRSVNNWGFLHIGSQSLKPIPIEALDLQSKQMAQQMVAQLKAQGVVEDEAYELQREIIHAVQWRLDDIQRDFSQLIHELTEPMHAREWQLDSESQNGHQSTWWGEYVRSGEVPVDHAQAHAYYVKSFLPKKMAENSERIKPIKEALRELGSFAALTRLVLCANCRKNLVLLHQAHNDKRLSGEAVCDSCVREKKRSPDSVKGSEWTCPQCGKVIYKFVNGNVLSARTQTKFPVVIELKYGQLEVEAYCPDCKIHIPATIDWGWLL